MSGNWFSQFGKRCSEDKMTSTALKEAKGWSDVLMNIEHKGRGDKEKSARHRLSKRTGVPESYLFRLQYKYEGMRDVAGEVYRLLKIAYDEACDANELAAEKHRAARIKLRGNHEAPDEEPLEKVRRVGKTNRREEETRP